MTTTTLRILGTDKIKGELMLPSMKRAIRPGAAIPISADALAKDDIQRLVRNGYVTVEGETEASKSTNETVRVQCLNAYPLVLPSINGALSPFQVFDVRRSVFGNTDIQQAISIGMLKEVTDDSPPEGAAGDYVAGLVAQLEGRTEDDNKEVPVFYNTMDGKPPIQEDGHPPLPTKIKHGDVDMIAGADAADGEDDVSVQIVDRTKLPKFKVDPASLAFTPSKLTTKLIGEVQKIKPVPMPPPTDEAEAYKDSGQAQTIHKAAVNSTNFPKVYDPRPQVEAAQVKAGQLIGALPSKPAGKKGKAVVRAIGRTVGDSAAADDGIDMEIIASQSLVRNPNQKKA